MSLKYPRPLEYIYHISYHIISLGNHHPPHFGEAEHMHDMKHTHTHLWPLDLIMQCISSGHRSGVGKFHLHMQRDQLTYRTSERESKREDLSDVEKGQHYERRPQVANSDTGVRWNLGRQDVKRSYFVRIAVAVCHRYG